MTETTLDIEQTIRKYIPQIVHMSLATASNNAPWVCEVHFAFDDKLNLYFRSLPSRRHSQEIAANPSVAGNIITQHFQEQTVRGVYFEGTAEKLADETATTEAFGYFRERFGMPDSILEETKQAMQADRDDIGWFYKITVDKFYVFDGYKSKPAQKYELTWNGGDR